jgi:hypothetical protein
MNFAALDAVIRHATDRVSRRGALMSLAGASLSAALTAPLSAEAKKDSAKKAKKKQKQKANQRCKNQIGQCVGWVEDMCAGEECDPEGKEQFLECCEHLGQCDARGFIECITTT